MAPENSETRNRPAWSLVRAQHGVIARRQLLALGFTHDAIKHRLRTGRLRRVAQGVYAVSRLDLSLKGRWMAAVLACGESACLSHRSAGALYGVCEERNGAVEVSVRRAGKIERPGIKVRSRLSLPRDKSLARAVNEADKLEVVRADDLRLALDAYAGVPGAKRLAALLDRDTFVLTQEELERLFLPMAREVGLPLPLAGEMVDGYEVDFFWPELKLVVETDGLRYTAPPLPRPRTPAATRLTPRRATPACGSPTTKSSTNPLTSSASSGRP